MSSRPLFIPEKPKSPTKRSEVNAEKPKVPIKPSSTSSSFDAPKQSPIPRLPIKSKPRIEDSPSASDAVDGVRPTLPLKQKDLCEFDSILSSKPEESSNGKENSRSTPSNNVIPIANKSRTFGRESSESKAERLDLWTKYSPDYEVASAGPSTRVPDADYAVVDFSSKTNRNQGKNQALQEAAKPMAPQRKTSNDRLVGRASSNDKKMASFEDIFTPFEPSSSVRVSPTPKATGQNGLPSSKNIPFAIKQTVDRTNQGNMASSDSNEIRKRDGLVRRTNQSISRKEMKNDPQAAKANYVISIQKTNAEGTNDAKRAPLAHKSNSWDALVGDRDGKETRQPLRFLSQDTKPRPSDQISDMADCIDSGKLIPSIALITFIERRITQKKSRKP